MRLYFFKSGIYIPLEEHRLAAPIMPFPHAAPEYDSVIAEWLAGYGVSLVHVRHSAFQGLGLIETARLQNIPVLYSFHDYYTVCPSVKLLDENQQFCRGRCTQSPGSCGIELWPDSLIASLKHNAVYQWQRQFARNLGLCSGFIACTAAVQHIVQDIFPAISEKPFALIEHGRDFDLLTSLACRPEPGTPLRVLLPGHLERAKGAEILLEMARAEGLQQVEWHVLGTVGTEFQHRMPANVKVHGGYQREAFQDHVKRIQPHMGAILSIWPETWCHTLTELWATGLPVVAFNLGAVGDRIAASQAGWLAEQVSAQAMIKTIKTASQTAEWANAQNHTMRWQREAQRSCADMAEDYWRFYQLFF